MKSTFWEGKRVLLTGHTGFKGCWTQLWLRRLGAEVRGLSLPPAYEPNLWVMTGASGGEESIGDIRSEDDVARVFAAFEPEIVLHMAAQALVLPSYDNPAETFDTNVMGLVRILDAARHSESVRAVVNVTSDKCYENVEQIWPYRETDRMGGSDPYSASKGCSELVTASYQRSFFKGEAKARLASGRAGNVIGGGDWAPDRLIPDCIRAFERGEPVILRNPSSTRPWQHVLEPISGYLTLAQRLYETGTADEGWNFGPSEGAAWPVSEVVKALALGWGDGQWQVETDHAFRSEAVLLRVDATKAHTLLGWAPRLTTAQALAWTVDWYSSVRNGASALDLTLQQIERYEQMPTLTGI